MTPWLPLISSLVIASVTLFGIRVNNRTNSAAIAAADEREYRKWQRETVLRQCAEAIETAMIAEHAYDHWLMGSAKDLGELKAMMLEYWRKLGANAAMLKMLNANAVADKCTHLQQFVWNVWESGEELVEQHSPDAFQDILGDLININETRCALVQLANAEVHQIGQRDSGNEITSMRERFLRARRTGG
ncbi:hypothetical protein ACIBG0_41855 [Nocardia sp. NPDC050630]|uniref:hypothetical protein n=1 Tax=Nocardia sp. NPDC050630 TaxID=3364321 RepID=UPI003798B16C